MNNQDTDMINTHDSHATPSAPASANTTNATMAGSETGVSEVEATGTTSAPHEDGNDHDNNGLAVLRAERDEARRQLEAEREMTLRARADFANFKRRTEEERTSLSGYLLTDLLSRLLPLVDNFERALNAAEQTKDYDKLIGGISATYRQMQELLTREGITPIEAVGQPFDPNIHNAVLREETTEYPENTVIEELQRGYMLGSRVLRPTMVKVAAGDA